MAPAAPVAGKTPAKDAPATVDVQTDSIGKPDAPPQAAAPHPDAPLPDEIMPERRFTTLSAVADKAVAPDATASVQTHTSPLTVAVAAPGPSPAPLLTPAPLAMTPVHAVLVASPAEVVDIVTRTAGDGQSDRVVVQLDPPELGRVSIDFKFDAQGLQHVTITSETPEAMRQLRAMHFELVQALERQGLDGQNMTFQHQQQSSQQAANAAMLKQLQTGPVAASQAVEPVSNYIAASGPIRADGRLDMRL
jgi:flagellar hook-length control protein FliK